MSPVVAGGAVVGVFVFCGFVSYVREGRALARRARQLDRAPLRTYGCGVAGTVVPLRPHHGALRPAAAGPRHEAVQSAAVETSPGTWSWAASASLRIADAPAAEPDAAAVVLDGRQRFEAARRELGEEGGC